MTDANDEIEAANERLRVMRKLHIAEQNQQPASGSVSAEDGAEEPADELSVPVRGERPEPPDQPVVTEEAPGAVASTAQHEQPLRSWVSEDIFMGGRENLLTLLKGAPLSLLLALSAFGAHSRLELAMLTGWNKRTVKNALLFLLELRLAIRVNYRAWQLTELGTHLARGLPGGRPARATEGARDTLSQETRPAGHAREGAPSALSGDRPLSAGSAEGALSTLSAHSRREVSYQQNEAVPRVGNAERAPGTLSGAQRFSVDLAEGALSTPSVRSGKEASYQPNEPVPRVEHAERAPGALSGARSSGGPARPRVEHVVVDHRYTNKEKDHQQHNITPARDETHDETDPYKLRLVQILRSFRPPFKNPEAWLERVSMESVSDWLYYLDHMPVEQRRAIRNPAAYVRRVVEKGFQAPPGRGRE